MPQYELMYIIASSVSDDQIPSVTDGVLNFITSSEGTVVREEKLGKKKLAYPIKKTRNGFYDVVLFEAEASKVAEIDMKVRNTDDIIRHLIVNMEESNRRQAKDVLAQENMNKNRMQNAKPETSETATESSGAKASEGTKEDSKSLDEKIEAALTEDIANA